MGSLSDAEVLELYKLARDRVITAMAAGDPTVEMQGPDGKRRRVVPSDALLKTLEEQIKVYEAKAGGGRVTNYADLQRR